MGHVGGAAHASVLEWALVLAAAIVLVWALALAIRYMVRPGETEPSPYCPKTHPMLRLRGGSSATARPTAHGNAPTMGSGTIKGSATS